MKPLKIITKAQEEAFQKLFKNHKNAPYSSEKNSSEYFQFKNILELKYNFFKKLFGKTFRKL